MRAAIMPMAIPDPCAGNICFSHDSARHGLRNDDVEWRR